MIYSKVGSSTQQIGGECPSGWVEMNVERPSSDHVSTPQGEWVIPSKTKTQKMADASKSYSATVESMKSQTVSALMLAGEEEAAKMAKIRADLATAQSDYSSTVAAIKAGSV